MAEFQSRIEALQQKFHKRKVSIAEVDPQAEYPQLFVTVPDSWRVIKLAPLFDVHIGSGDHDKDLFEKHLDWIAGDPYVLTWNGGDMVENANKYSPGASMLGQEGTPQEQIYTAAKKLARIQHKMLFAIPGNHEDRTFLTAGVDGAAQLAEHLKLPYFPDYCFCTLKWRGNRFRICAHHGSGAAQTPGAQRNAARKDMPWANFDIFWTGHLHQPMCDLVFRVDHDKDGNIYERDALIVISPSYTRYFGTYAAKKRMAPGVRGLTVITLNPDGRIDASMHAKGRRI